MRSSCICKGNLRAIYAEYLPKIDKVFTDQENKEWLFFGIVLGGDDYYYGMKRLEDGKTTLYSCVGYLEGDMGWQFSLKEYED